MGGGRMEQMALAMASMPMLMSLACVSNLNEGVRTLLNTMCPHLKSGWSREAHVNGTGK